MHLDAHLPLLVDLLLKSTVLLAIAALVWRVCRGASAANRHAIAVATLVALLLLPFTKLARPRWSYEWKPDPLAVPVKIEFPQIADNAATEAFAASRASVPQTVPARQTISRVNWPAIAVGIWLVGFLLVLVHRAGVALQLRRLARQSRPVDASRVLERARELAATSGVRAELRESPACRVPLVFGIWRPTVVLPSDAIRWSDEHLSAALLHEFGHVRRRDCLTRFLANLACAFYWVNPLVWAGARALRLAQEQACDDLVLRAGTPADRYATQLVNVVRNIREDRFSARHAIAMAQQSAIETRVRAIVDENRDRSPRSRRTAAAGCLTVAFAVAICTAAQVLAADANKAATAMERGLAFLATRQNEDGSVGPADFRGGVGVSSLAGLAWVGSAAHAGNTERLAKFILSCQRDDGYIVGAAPRTGSMYDHGYATLFLAEYWKATSAPGVREKLAKAVDLIVKSQGNEGGWRYSPTPANGDTSVSSCQLMALAAARNAGLDVPAATIGAGIEFLKRCQNPDGGFSYTAPGSSAFPRSAASLAASLAGSKWTEPSSQPDAVKGANYVMLFLPQAVDEPKKGQFFIHGHYYAGQALQAVGGEHWKRWQEAIRESLLDSQRADGSWADEMSVELATSEACLTLKTQKVGPAK
jgi:beta-lactamase regulating signal transducer with metallopeptidase domain